MPVTGIPETAKRFAHLFGKEPDEVTLNAIQAMADKNIRVFNLDREVSV